MTRASLMLQFECFSFSKVVDPSGKTQVSCAYWGACKKGSEPAYRADTAIPAT